MSDNPYQKTGSSETTRAAQQLANLPTLEDTENQLESRIEELGAYVSSLVPGLTWEWVDERSTAECDPPFDQTQGRMVDLRNYISHPAIPDAVWPQVLDRARHVAASFGATEVEVFADQPGNHTVRFYSHESTAVFVGSRGAVIRGGTGCRLPAAIKNASQPTEPPSEAPR